MEKASRKPVMAVTTTVRQIFCYMHKSLFQLLMTAPVIAMLRIISFSPARSQDILQDVLEDVSRTSERLHAFRSARSERSFLVQAVRDGL